MRSNLKEEYNENLSSAVFTSEDDDVRKQILADKWLSEESKRSERIRRFLSDNNKLTKMEFFKYVIFCNFLFFIQKNVFNFFIQNIATLKMKN